MKEIEAKLRAGIARNGISHEAQEQIILSITSFALYGFPESHAASFALIAYASAYLKCHYLAAFLYHLVDNQPMGFLSRHHHERRTAPRIENVAGGCCDLYGMDVHAGNSGQWSVVSRP